MFGFVTDLYNSLTGNTGSGSATDKAKGALTKANDNLGAASQVRAGGNPGASSDATAGFTGSGGGGQAGDTNLDLTRITSNPEVKTLKVVGTSVNQNKPSNTPGGNNFEKSSGSGANNFKGFSSLINPYYLVRYHSIMDGNENSNAITDLNVSEGSIDYKGLADYEQYKNPSTSLIISHYSEGGPGANQPERRYSYGDFLYMKHYHPFNNNRLITLRRFMAPVYDELRVAIKDEGPESLLRKPIAQALSYIDGANNKLSAFTKMNVTINTKAITSPGEDNNATTLQEAADFLGIGKAGQGSAKDLQDTGIKLLSILSGTGTDGNIGALDNWTSAYDPWKNGPLQDLVYGPVNVITGAKTRARGLKFTHNNFKVTFEYSSKTIENVNQKAAMLDILSNMLALTYNHALFWGGENRFLIDRANFPLFRTEMVFSLLKNLKDPTKLKDELFKQFGSASAAVSDRVGGFLKDIIDNPIKALTDSKNQASLTAIASQYLFANSQSMKDLQRTVLEKTKSELTGAPTGEWHLQVGNPFTPIMMIGNLWCTTTDMEFNDELSIDDFPTEFKYTCTLEHGRGRDASDIQSIFNGGGGRIYYPYADSTVDVNASSSTFTTSSQSTLKDTDVRGAFNRTTVDNSGRNISDLVKAENKTNKVLATVFQPIGTVFK